MSMAVVLFGEAVIAKASGRIYRWGQRDSSLRAALGSSHCECILILRRPPQNRVDFSGNQSVHAQGRRRPF
jgi:hypothetical protein